MALILLFVVFLVGAFLIGTLTGTSEVQNGPLPSPTPRDLPTAWASSDAVSTATTPGHGVGGRLTTVLARADPTLEVHLVPYWAGSVVINGTTFYNGQIALLSAGEYPLGLDLSHPRSAKFGSWGTSGSVSLQGPVDSATLNVSGSGTLWANFSVLDVVTFEVNPWNCGGVSFDQATYPNGSAAYVPNGSYPINARVCPWTGQPSYSTKGNLSLEAAGSLVYVDGNGTLEVNYFVVSVTLSGPRTVSSGAPTTFYADVDGGYPPYVIVFAWGDGTNLTYSPGAPGPVGAIHNWSIPRLYNVSVTVKDSVIHTVVATFTVRVNASSPLKETSIPEATEVADTAWVMVGALALLLVMLLIDTRRGSRSSQSEPSETGPTQTADLLTPPARPPKSGEDTPLGAAPPGAPPADRPFAADRIEAPAIPRRRGHLRRKPPVAPILVLSALVTLAAFAWLEQGGVGARGESSGCPTQADLGAVGSDFSGAALSLWAAQFSGGELNCTVVTVEDQAGSGGGAYQVFRGLGADFLITEEPLAASQILQLPYPVLTLPIALGGLAVTYNVPGAPAKLDLTGMILAQIYLGQVRWWNDSAIEALNPGLEGAAPEPIHVFYDDVNTSMNFVLASFLSQEDPLWANTVGAGADGPWPVGTGVNGSSELATTVELTSGAIGYASLPQATTDHLSEAAIENPAGQFVPPAPATVTAAASNDDQELPCGAGSWSGYSLLNVPGNTSYAISTYTFAIVYNDSGVAYGPNFTSADARWLANFLYYIVVQAQSGLSALGLPPLPVSTVAGATDNDLQTLGMILDHGHPTLPGNDVDGGLAAQSTCSEAPSS